MSNLTGQQIKDTYYGLLNLQTATTGVTTTPQQIQDGLGNNTGVAIAQNFLTAPNVFPMNQTTTFVPDFMGPGFASAALTPQANQQNRLHAFLFYDSGKYAYSAISYNIVSATSTSDVVEVAFYNTQYRDGEGIIPFQLIMSGITLSASPGGSFFVQTNLPSTLSFSGSGGGFYYMVLKISNAGVTPTVRYGINVANNTALPALYTQMLGLTRNRAQNATAPGIGTNASSAGYVMTQTNFQQTFSSADGVINTGVNAYVMGFALRCVK